MSYHAKLTSVLDAYIVASMKTQSANEEFNAASELMDRAGANLDDAVTAEDVAFSALMELRKDVLDGGYDDPAPVVEAPVEPAPVIDTPAPIEAPAVIENIQTLELVTEAPVAEPVVEIVPEPVAEITQDVVVAEDFQLVEDFHEKKSDEF